MHGIPGRRRMLNKTHRLPISSENARVALRLLRFWREQPAVSNREQQSKPVSKSLAYCEEGRRLLDEFGDKVQELILLHEQQFLAITSGDSDCDRFDLLIHMANEHKQRAKYEYLRHLET